MIDTLRPCAHSYEPIDFEFSKDKKGKFNYKKINEYMCTKCFRVFKSETVDPIVELNFKESI